MASPLRAYLRVEHMTQAELRQVLQDAAEEAERLIPKLLEQGGIGKQVRAAQLSLVLREIRALMAATFGDVGRVVQAGRLDAAEAAAQGEDILLSYLRSTGLRKQADVLLESFVAQAKKGFATIRAKAANGIPLSSQVYRTQALATGLVNRVVSRGLLLGHGAREIAKDVRDLISPNVRGGVSYAAIRLARTELNNAFKTAQETRYQDEPWTRGMRWNLSGSHPAPDVCNVNAEQDLYGLGDGVYPVGQRPDSHPNCLCFLTPEQIEEDDFVEGFLRGEYDEYLDGVDGGSQAQQAIAEVIPINRNEDLPGAVLPSPLTAGNPDDLFRTTGVRAALRDNRAFRASHRGEVSSDIVMEAIAREAGIDGTPALVSAAEVDGMVEQGSPLIMRAMREAQHTDNLRTGRYYAGVGDQGNGIYFSYRDSSFSIREEVIREEYGRKMATLTDEEILSRLGQEEFDDLQKTIRRRGPKVLGRMLDITRTYGEHVVRGSIRPGTNIKRLREDVYPLQAEYLRLLQERLDAEKDEVERSLLEQWIQAMRDPGRFAAANGIPAYYGTTPGEIIVVDRSVLALERENL